MIFTFHSDQQVIYKSSVLEGVWVV